MVPAEPIVFTLYIQGKFIIRTFHNYNKFSRGRKCELSGPHCIDTVKKYSVYISNLIVTLAQYFYSDFTLFAVSLSQSNSSDEAPAAATTSAAPESDADKLDAGKMTKRLTRYIHVLLLSLVVAEKV